MEVTNVKFHFNIYHEDLKRKLLECKEVTKTTASFCVVRLNESKLVFCIYYKGFVNGTGVRNLLQLESALTIFKAHFDLESKEIGLVTIDNISSTYKPAELKPVNLCNLIAQIKEEKCIKSIKYNRERFPGLFLKTDFGTLIWFATNTVISIGAKTRADLLNLSTLVTTYY